jgi:hypothetical protein
MSTVIQPVDIEPVRASGLGAALRKACAFPALLGTVLVAGVCASVYLKLREVPTLPSGHAHVSIIEGDTWLHILAGENLLETHRWPTTDSYSFTAYGNDAIAYEWLPEVGMALVDHLGGLRGLTASLLVLAATLVLLLYYYAWLRSNNSKAAFVACALVLPLASPFFTLRPQLLGYVFLAITLICLEHFRRGHKRVLWVLPGLFVLWVNTHPAFVLGLMVLGLYWAGGLVGFELGGLRADPWTGRERRQLALVFLLSLLGLTVTPYGTQVAGFTLDYALHTPLGMAHIVEFQPLGTMGGLLKFFLALLLLFVLAQAVLRPTYRLEEMVLLLGAIYGACVHLRLLLFFLLIFAPLLARLLARGVPPYDRANDHYVLNAVLVGLIVLGLARFFPSQQEMERVVACAFPRGAVDYLRRHPASARMFNNELWGAYLVRSLGRDHRIFMDGRSQVYEKAGVFGDYLRITAVDPDTAWLLRKYGVEACLIERDAPLATLLAALPPWKRVYQDDLSVLFEKNRTEESGVRRKN